jgi:hypothetical protein
VRKAFVAVVVVTVVAHLGYLIYLPSGGFVALRRPRSIWLHLAAVSWGVGVVVLHFPCPLTSLERWARARAGLSPLPATGFIDRYVAGVLYPADRTGTAQAFAFGSAAISWVALATKRSRRPHRQPALRS